MIARGSPFGGGGGVPWFILILLAYAFITGGIASPIRNAANDPVAFVGFVVAIVLGITVHEFMHAYTAHRFGDDTAKHMGRLSLDPRAHLDLFGSLLIVLIGFGYGRPVPVNESRMAAGRVAYALVSLAGPLTNFALAAIAAIPLRFGAADVMGDAYREILLLIVFYNCLLGVFNLIPIPPLDGSRVVYGLLPPRQAYTWRSYEQYGPMILMALLFIVPYLLRINVLGVLVQTPAAFLARTLLGPGF